MAERVPLVGGPLDGHAVAKQRGRYAWVGGKKSIDAVAAGHFRIGAIAAYEGKTATAQPADGRALYELDEAGERYVYAGHRRLYCNQCGCYHGRAEGGRERRPCALGGDDAT